MDEQSKGFRGALFGGFKREDVLQYIEQTDSKYYAETEELRRQLTEAQAALTELRSQNARDADRKKRRAARATGRMTSGILHHQAQPQSTAASCPLLQQTGTQSARCLPHQRIPQSVSPAYPCRVSTASGNSYRRHRSAAAKWWQQKPAYRHRQPAANRCRVRPRYNRLHGTA